MTETQFTAEDGAILRGARIVDDYRTIIGNNLKTIRGQVERTIQSWEGGSQQQFMQLMSSWDARASKVTAILDDFRAKLTTSDTNYNETDSTVGQGYNKMNGILS